MSEGMFNPYDAIRRIAKNGLDNQVKNPGDYVNEEGVLICGKCGEPRQKWIELQGNTTCSKLLVIEMCKCEKDEEARRKKAEQDAKDMERIHRLRAASLIDEKFENSTFENFRINKYNERNLQLCKRYAERFDLMVEKNQGLVLWGDVGTGKSFAAACIANSLLNRGVPVIMTSFVKLLEVIQSSYDQESDLLNRFGYAKLVIFDDLGAERGTDYALEKVYNIIDSRYRKKLPMILTTNLTLDEMKKERDIRYSRIYDRIFEVCYPMQFTGTSWRKREASKRFGEMESLLEG